MQTSFPDPHHTLAYLITEALALSDELGLGLVAISLESAMRRMAGVAPDIDAHQAAC